MPGPYYTNVKVDDVDYMTASDLEAIETGFSNVDADKANKSVPAVAGDFAVLDGSGDLFDSGKTPPSGEVVGTTDPQTLTSKTLTSPTINSPTITSAAINGATGTGTWNITGTLQLDGVSISTTGVELNLLSGLTASASDLNKLDGSAATALDLNKLAAVEASATELNRLIGLTSSASDLNKLDGSPVSAADLSKLAAVTASSSEINLLDGLTASASDLNKLDGSTVTTPDLDKLSAVTATSTELNILDGATITTSNLNDLASVGAEITYLSGASSNIQAQIDAISSQAAHPSFNATGSITAGMPVTLESDGTVKALDYVETFESGTIASLGVTTDVHAITYDPINDAVVVAYKNGVDSVAVVAGTLSGNDISFGTPVNVFAGTDGIDTVDAVAIAYDETADVVVVAVSGDSDNSTYNALLVRAGTISGTVVSFPSAPVSFGTDMERGAGPKIMQAVYTPSAGKVSVISADNDDDLEVFIVGVSGTTVTLSGSAKLFAANVTQATHAAYDSFNQKLVIAWASGASWRACYATVGAASIDFSSVIAGTGTPKSISYDPASQYILLHYRGGSNNDILQTFRCGATRLDSYSTVNLGSAFLFSGSAVDDGTSVYDSVSGNTLVFSASKMVNVSFSGSTPVFSEAIIHNVSGSGNVAAVADPVNGGAFLAFDNAGSAARYLDLNSASNVDDYVGIAQNTVTDGNSVSVALRYQISSAHTSLTPGQDYWFNPDGSLSIFDTGYSKAGTALTDTSLQVFA